MEGALQVIGFIKMNCIEREEFCSNNDIELWRRKLQEDYNQIEDEEEEWTD